VVKKYFCLIILLFISSSCVRAPLSHVSQALKVSTKPSLSDDLGTDSLAKGIGDQITALEKRADANMTFGQKKILRSDYILALKYLRNLLTTRETTQDFFTAIERDFDFYAIYGGKDFGDALVTSYFEPEIEGSLTKTELFSEPLYAQPGDMLEIALSQFDRCPGCPSRLVGRLQQEKGKSKVVPYYSRAEIAQKSPFGQELVLCWVKPVDAFFLHIQGSGTVLLPDAQPLRLGYSSQNGHRYVGIGSALNQLAKEKNLPPPSQDLHSIEKILNSMSREQMQSYLNKNPSYVFFRRLESERPITSFGTEVSDGRTIAADMRYFPKGALAFLSFDRPVFADENQLRPLAWQKTARFVLDQDTGGAIKGGQHIDLFWGKGKIAKQHAGVMKVAGQLWYIAPKDSLIAALKTK